MSTREHAKRMPPGARRLHPDVEAAYAYVDRVRLTADAEIGGARVWHGWALREAFLAGITYANKASKITGKEITGVIVDELSTLPPTERKP